MYSVTLSVSFNVTATFYESTIQKTVNKCAVVHSIKGFWHASYMTAITTHLQVYVSVHVSQQSDQLFHKSTCSAKCIAVTNKVQVAAKYYCNVCLCSTVDWQVAIMIDVIIFL